MAEQKETISAELSDTRENPRKEKVREASLAARCVIDASIIAFRPNQAHRRLDRPAVFRQHSGEFLSAAGFNLEDVLECLPEILSAGGKSAHCLSSSHVKTCLDAAAADPALAHAYGLSPHAVQCAQRLFNHLGAGRDTWTVDGTFQGGKKQSLRDTDLGVDGPVDTKLRASAS